MFAAQYDGTSYQAMDHNNKVFQWQQFFYDAYRTWGVFYAAAYRDLRQLFDQSTVGRLLLPHARGGYS